MRREISASVDGGPSGGSHVPDPGARTPIAASGNYGDFLLFAFYPRIFNNCSFANFSSPVAISFAN